MRLTRRGLLGAIVLVLGCRGKGKADRCALCGMPIDPRSGWRADLSMTDGSTRHFDSPLCALKAWREGHVDARSMRVIDYYDGRWRDARELLFVAGSDVSGPMGPDLVPVDAARAQKFSEDHAAARPLPLAAITPEIVSQIR